MTRENSYATLDSTGNVPLDQLDNAAGGGPHVHSGADITTGTVADARVDAALARDSEVTSAVTTHEAAADPHTGYVREADANWVDLTDGGASTLHSHAASGAPADPDYLVGTAHAGLSAEIVVGTTPGGELGGTWASPTVDATHSGSTHAATQAAAEAAAAAALSGHEADTTAVHGIADTSVLSLTSHDHDADYEATGAVATHAGLADPHTGYRLESADHSHASTGLQAGTVDHGALTGLSDDDHPQYATNTEFDDHSARHENGGADEISVAGLSGLLADGQTPLAHTASHAPTGTDPIDPYLQSEIGTADLAIANTETVVCQRTFAANELIAGATFMFKAYATRAGTTSASPVIRIRIGTTTLTGNIAATLTPPVNTLAVGNSIEGIVTIRSAGAGGTALGSLRHTVHLAAVTITEAMGVSTATVAVNTTSAGMRIELTFISGNAANTYTWRNAVIYRVN